ncbi:MAG: ribonuclease Y [Acidobacteria bacterium]|nr:ribonuclease Y [Acidobacteriota bacterium]
MDIPVVPALTGLVLGVVILVAYYYVKTRMVDQKLEAARKEADDIRERANKDAAQLKKERLLEAKDEIFQLKMETENEFKEKKKELAVHEKNLLHKENGLNRRDDQICRREKELATKENQLIAREVRIKEDETKIRELRKLQEQKLEHIAAMTREEAKQHLIQMFEEEAKRDATQLVKQIEDDARFRASNAAKKVIATAIQRCAADHVVETTVSVVDLPNDEMKGRIIGREGRNIRALETATGVDLIVDDTPEAVILSGYDPYRREIAKLAIEALISDGRIHPARIEEVVEKVRAEMEQRVLEIGEQAAFELGIHDFHPEIMRLLGRLNYRSSYGQNVLQHSKEVAYIAAAMAQEIKANDKVARRAALIHDIGKAVDREVEGTHTQLGCELARKYGEKEDVIHCIEAHHFDVDFQSVEAVLVQAADAISAARPGARREILESYIKRLEKLENIADSFSGVAKAFALQAGREIRVMVESDKIADEQAFWLAKDLTKKIESDLQYPGQIKVTVIRERRFIEYAK